MSDHTEAQRLVEEGSAHSDAGDAAAAERAYLAAIALEPAWSIAHYNLGLLCKYQPIHTVDWLRRAARSPAPSRIDGWRQTASPIW